MEPTPTRPPASTRILELIDIKMNTQEIVNKQQPTKSQVMKTTSDLIFPLQFYDGKNYAIA